MRISSLVFAAILGASAPALASVIVVDPSNGPGTDFTSLSAAIQAAAPGDVLLLRTGTYDGSFVVSGKTLSIFADDGAHVQITNSALGNPAVPALKVGSDYTGTVLLRGLELSTPIGGGIPLIVDGTPLPGCHVWIEDCNVPTSGSVGMRLDNGSPVTVTRCNVNGAPGTASPAPDGWPISLASPALHASWGQLAVFASQFAGGNGLVAGLHGPQQTPFPGEDGASGVDIQYQSETWVRMFSTSIFIGGTGGDGAAPGAACLLPGDGGDGLFDGLNGNVHVAGVSGTGGLAGAPAAGCTGFGASGKFLDSFPPEPLPELLPGQPAKLVVSPVVREGHSAQISVSGAFQQTIGLLVGFAPQFDYLPKWSGVMVVTPTFVVPAGSTGFSGAANFQVHVPELGPGVKSVIAYVQVFGKDAAGHKLLGQPTAVLLLDSQF